MRRTLQWLLRRRHPAAAIFVLLASTSAVPAAGSDPGDSADEHPGRTAYRFYCYQCHGYAGDADTLASSYLSPEPRDFTAHTDETLSAAIMVDAVQNGRPGTAMVSFTSVLDEAEIRQVVDYIRETFMSGVPAAEKYHSAANGWIDHDRHASAFPFVLGTLAINTPLEELDPNQQYGKQLFLSACITCHAQANTGSGRTTWELRAVSFPREHFSHRASGQDFVSGASPYALHDVPAVPENMSPQQSTGMNLYQDNCAFCHAADGSGRNWIGSFLEPRPRDFTDPNFNQLADPVALRELIKIGVPGSSMPAWRAVLRDDQIDDIVAYMQVAFGHH